MPLSHKDELYCKLIFYFSTVGLIDCVAHKSFQILLVTFSKNCVAYTRRLLWGLEETNKDVLSVTQSSRPSESLIIKMSSYLVLQPGSGQEAVHMLHQGFTPSKCYISKRQDFLNIQKKKRILPCCVS